MARGRRQRRKPVTADDERLRARIDSGKTGDKVAMPDPAAAPLGTDAEASPAELPLGTARPRPAIPAHGRTQTGGAPKPNKRIAWPIVGFVVALVLTLIAIVAAIAW